MNAVVLISGGAAVTPFTTPDRAARSGLAAGNTMTALRAHLLDAGVAVYSAPARIGPGVVESDDGWQGFSDAGVPLPAEMTVNSAGSLADAGVALDAFLSWLRESHGVSRVDVVAHSMGGLFVRSALAAARHASGRPHVDRLVTLGTPWTGSLLGDYRDGGIRLADAHGDADTVAILQKAKAFADDVSQGAADEVTSRFLAGESGWNARQRGVLDDVAVTLVGGDFFSGHDRPRRLWPHDGLVQLCSALGEDVPAAVLPHRTVHRLDDVHSIFFADAFGLPWERALTWDPRVFEIVDAALARSG